MSTAPRWKSIRQGATDLSVTVISCRGLVTNVAPARAQLAVGGGGGGSFVAVHIVIRR